MYFIILLVIGLVQSALIIFGLLKFAGASDGGKQLEEKGKHTKEARNLLQGRVETAFSELRPIAELTKLVQAARTAADTLKADRGRVTITQAELETVEGRLRELEEIERELEASSIETEEEVKILKNKQQELTSKNGSLKEQIRASSEQIELLLSELKDNAIVQERVLGMKTSLVLTEQKTEELVVQIELGNEQYFELKRRYDALDIEYAQLYEKFSEAEAQMNKGKS